MKGFVIFGLRLQIPSNRNQQPILHIPDATHLGGTSWPLIQGCGGVPPTEQQNSLLKLTLRWGGLLFLFPVVRCGRQRNISWIVLDTCIYDSDGFYQIGT